MFNFKSKSNDVHIFRKTLANFHKLKVVCMGAILVKKLSMKVTAFANEDVRIFAFLKTKIYDRVTSVISVSDKLKAKFRITDISSSLEKIHAKILIKLGFIKTTSTTSSSVKYLRRIKTTISTNTTASVGKLINRQYVKARIANISDSSLHLKNRIIAKLKIKNSETFKEELIIYHGKPKKLSVYQDVLLCNLPESLKACCFSFGTENWKDVSSVYSSWEEVRSNFTTWQDLM